MISVPLTILNGVILNLTTNKDQVDDWLLYTLLALSALFIFY